MSFSDKVGIRFLEVMSGKVGGNGVDQDAGDFAFDLQLVIPSLRKFLDAELHVANIESGWITWSPFLNERVPVKPGRVVLYRSEDHTRKRKYFDFDFTFDSGSGYDLRAEGHKHVINNTGFDAATDLSTVFMTLHGPNGPVARGVVTVHINELLRQLRSMQVTGAANKAEEKAAMSAFFAFMNRELREVYPSMPLIVKEEGKFTLEERRTLEMCVRIMLPDPLPADGAQMGDVVDYLEDFMTTSPSDELDEYRNVLHAVGLILPVLGNDVKGIRKFAADQLKGKTRTVIRDVLSFVHTLVALPYYAHPKTDKSVDYHRPIHEPHAAPLRLPVLDEPPHDGFDVVIAGSGPAGAILAARFAKANKRVLVLEAGPYVPEYEITPDEMYSLAKLYKAGGLQRANEQMSIFDTPGPTFFVLQGGALGGGAVVNNTVCFQMPPERLRQWENAGFPIDEGTMRKAYAKLAKELPILPVSRTAKHINQGGNYLTAAFGQPRVPPVDAPPSHGFYECLVNLEPLDQHGHGCLGKGVCNVGCGSERKRNALQVHLREAAQHGCVIVHNAKVRDLIFDKTSRTVTAVGVQLKTGYKQIRGKEFILAAGPIGSTEILLRSASLKEHFDKNNVPVGKRFSANLGSPVWAFTKDDAQDPPGLQIAHYYYPQGGNPPFVFETWYNPPGANAVAMPGFMGDHFERMQKYMRTVAAAPLVGSQPRGEIKLRNNKLFVRLPVGAEEVEGFAHGLSVLAGAFAKHPQIDHALVGFGAGRIIRNDADADKLREQLLKLKKEPKHLHLLKMGTGHPQGGNAMSMAPIGVVSADFRVRGVKNLRVCDGSVFPDSSAVNPQWTIMALAEICASDMLGTPLEVVQPQPLTV